MITVRAKRVQTYVASLIMDLLLLAALTFAIASTGCTRKEKVLDIKTPGTDVEVKRDKDTGQVDVNVRNNK